MGLADKDKLSCPLLLHMIFSTLCTGFTPVKEKKGSFFTEKDLLIEQILFHLYSVRHLIHLRLLFVFVSFSFLDKNQPATAIPTNTI